MISYKCLNCFAPQPGFSQCESSIAYGSGLSELNTQFFLKWNIPFHIIYSASYGIASLCLIFQQGHD